MNLQRIGVFCGSNLGIRPVYRQAAASLALILADRRIEVVYGGAGADIGLMGVLAETALAAGGRVIGVIPEALVAKEVAHHGLTELRIVKSMHERKALMADLSDGFIALPGGFGTFEEFCEIVTWSQLGLHSKPCGVLNIHKYFDPLLALFDHAVGEGFLSREDRQRVLDDSDPAQLLEVMDHFLPARTGKWIGRDER